jgi:hypothetical protein
LHPRPNASFLTDVDDPNAAVRGAAPGSAPPHHVAERTPIGLDSETHLSEPAMFRYSLWGLIVLVADVWAIVNIIQSTADTMRKVLWTVVVLVAPLLGFVLWLLFGPRAPKA